MRSRLRAVAVAMLGSGLLAGCVYFNTLYNAEALYREAEDLRLAGQDTGVQARYEEVIAKATKGYEGDRAGGWADDALLLIAKAQLRLGKIPEASQALEQVLEMSTDPDLRAQAALYRGAAYVAVGETARGLAILDGAIEGIEDPFHRAEGHLWRARALFDRGMVEQGWRDLDRASEANRGHEVTVGLERIAWGFAVPDLTRIHQGVQDLIFTRRAQSHGDSVMALVGRFADRWGSQSAVVLLADAEDGHWGRAPRDRLLMTRAQLSYEAGDVEGATRDARRVASGLGEEALDARVTMAMWRLAEAETVDDLARLRSILLPAVNAVRAQDLLNAMRRVELLNEYGRDGEPVALMAAAEISRDLLFAPRLAAALFQAYAVVPEAPWTGKALLATQALTSDPARRQWLDRRLDALPEDPFVRYARTAYHGSELGELESRLQGMLDELIARVDEELAARRQLAGVPDN